MTASRRCGLAGDATSYNTSLELDGRRGYDSDFNKFMSKMFSAMPQGQSTVRQVKQGPNIGFIPYWYGYNFAKGKLQKQTLTTVTEDWDYGLDGAKGRNIWGYGKKKVLIGGVEGKLGAGAAVDDDGEEKSGTTRDPEAPINWGPAGVLGPRADDYDAATLEKMRVDTLSCDKRCAKEDLAIGVVCAMDKKHNFFEIDRCVMKKNNCLRGIAYIKDLGKYQNFTNLIAVDDEFVRISIRGTRDAHIWVGEAPRMTSIHGEGGGFEIAIDSYGVNRHSAVFRGRERASSWPAPGKYWTAMRRDRWTEYSMVWDPVSGWFLMSQPRAENWRKAMFLEYLNPHPLDIRYVAVSGKHGWTVEYILHDLEELNTGFCSTENLKDEMPEDTAEVVKITDKNERDFKERMKKLEKKGIKMKGPRWHVEGGSEREY